MESILFVCANPSIDKVTVVPNYRLGQIHRPQRVIKLAGGKGINAARAARLLGANVGVCILVGGHSGRWLIEQLQGENTPYHAAWTQGDTRMCDVVADPDNRRLTEVYEYGATITGPEWTQFETLFGYALGTASLVVISGSLPPGAPPDGYARLARLAHRQGVGTLVDTSGLFLEKVLETHPYGVKINQDEAGALLGHPLDSILEVKVAALSILGRGVSVAMITMGRRGIVAAAENDVWYAKPPPTDAYLSVGSGDAVMGALAFCCNQRMPLKNTLVLAVAAGLANALVPGTGVLDPETVYTVVEQVELVAI